MDELLAQEAERLQKQVEAGTMNGYLSYLGFCAQFAVKVMDQITVDKED